MAKVLVLESFEDDLAHVTSPRMRRRLIEAVALLEPFPRRGSQDLPDSTRKRFGNARKIVVPPLDIIYTYDESTDTVVVQGIVHARTQH